jgi:hypothetical protein
VLVGTITDRTATAGRAARIEGRNWRETMITSAEWWKIVIGAVCFGFGFAGGTALFADILGLFRKGGAQ